MFEDLVWSQYTVVQTVGDLDSLQTCQQLPIWQSYSAHVDS